MEPARMLYALKMIVLAIEEADQSGNDLVTIAMQFGSRNALSRGEVESVLAMRLDELARRIINGG